MPTSQLRLPDVAHSVRGFFQGLPFDAIRSPRHWKRRRSELASLEPRRQEIERELSEHCGHSVRLVSVQAQRSYDEVFFALRDGERFGVVRVNSPVKSDPEQPTGTDHLVVPLLSTARLDREWNAYSQLAPLGLSPQPLWRCADAIACEWLHWPRMSESIIRDRHQFWPLLACILPAVRRMHDGGVVHLDLNPGNLLIESQTQNVAFIDFEFGPVDWISVPQQRAYDYLRLIAECLRRRRGGPQLLSDADQLIRLLDEVVDADTRQAEIALSDERLHRLAAQPALCQKLRTVFTQLRD
jgi:hypothetical protein